MKLCDSPRLSLAHLPEDTYLNNRDEKYWLPGWKWVSRKAKGVGSEMDIYFRSQNFHQPPLSVYKCQHFGLTLRLGLARAAIESDHFFLGTVPTILVDKRWCLKAWLCKVNQPSGVFLGLLDRTFSTRSCHKLNISHKMYVCMDMYLHRNIKLYEVTRINI